MVHGNKKIVVLGLKIDGKIWPIQKCSEAEKLTLKKKNYSRGSGNWLALQPVVIGHILVWHHRKWCFGFVRAVRNKMACWLPNFEDFFLSLGRLIESSEEQINSASWDASEFLVRRLEEYEQTLSTLIARFSEAYGQANSQQTCIAQLHHLLNRTTSLRAHFQQRCLVYWIEEDENEEQNGILHLERSESPGHPR